MSIRLIRVGAGLRPSPTVTFPYCEPPLHKDPPLHKPPQHDPPLHKSPLQTRPFTEPRPLNHLPSQPKRHGLSEIVRAFKSFSSRRINELMESSGTPTWQRNYYEHIIRDQRELRAIQEYILANPINWPLDQDNPVNLNNPFP